MSTYDREKYLRNKAAHLAKTNRWRRANAEKVREAARKRRAKNRDKINSIQKVKRLVNREALLAKQRARRQRSGIVKNDEQRRNYNKRMRRYYEKNMAKIRARRAVNKKGAIDKSNRTCAIGNNNCTKTIQAHHADYNLRLEIEFLCARHHKAWHRVFAAIPVKER